MRRIGSDIIDKMRRQLYSATHRISVSLGTDLEFDVNRKATGVIVRRSVIQFRPQGDPVDWRSEKPGHRDTCNLPSELEGKVCGR